MPIRCAVLVPSGGTRPGLGPVSLRAPGTRRSWLSCLVCISLLTSSNSASASSAFSSMLVGGRRSMTDHGAAATERGDAAAREANNGGVRCEQGGSLTSDGTERGGAGGPQGRGGCQEEGAPRARPGGAAAGGTNSTVSGHRATCHAVTCPRRPRAGSVGAGALDEIQPRPSACRVDRRRAERSPSLPMPTERRQRAR